MKFLLIYVPNLRFSQFIEPWSNYVVSELLSTFPTNSLSWDQLTNKQDSSLKNLHYGLIHNGFAMTCITGDNQLFPYIKHSFIPTKYALIQNGDLILADASEDRKDVGRPVEMLDIRNQKIVSGLHTIHARNKTDLIANGFKGFYFQSSAMKQQIFKIANGSKIYGISSSAFNELKMSIPEKKEQKKIVDLMIKIEERILTQIKIINDYKILKNHIIKSFIKQNGTSYLLLEIAELGRGRVINSAEISKQKNPIYPVYSSQTSNNGIMGYLDNYDYEGEYITWTTDGANAGTVYYRNGKFNCTNVCGILKIKNGYDAYYISNILNCYTKKYVSTNLANPKLMNNVMANIKINLPSIEQQKHSSKILQSIEYRVEIEEDIKLNLVKQKAFLLKNMFI